jgi:hypothetical protein
MSTYHPPTNIDIPWKVFVLRRDPDYEREKRNQLEYQFSNGRQFFANQDHRGPYAED